MQLKRVMTASVAALAIGLAAPAVAQDSSTNEAGPGSADNNTSVNIVDGLDLLSNNSAGNGNNRDNDQSVNDSYNDNSDAFDLLSNNGNGNNRDNDQSTTNTDFDLLSNNRLGNGDNRDNDDNGNNRDNENYGSWSASRGGEISESGNTVSGNSDAEDSYNDNSGQAEIVATQVLIAVNSNSQLDEVADFDGEDDTSSSVGYNSGDQSVNGNSFSAFAGILNQAWNTGLNANTQAATNIAAQGTVTFGDAGGADGGAGGGD